MFIINKLIGFLCLFLAASIWGGLYVVSKYLLEFIPSITLIWIKYFIGSIALFPILMISNYRKPNKVTINKKCWFLILKIGFIGYFLSVSLQFIGTDLSDAHTGSLITASSPIFVTLFARFILKETITKKKLVSLIISTIGVIIIVGLDSPGGNYFLGSILLVGAAITWSLLSVYVKIASKYTDSISITSYATLIALIFITPIMLFQNNNFNLILTNRYLLWGSIYIGVMATAVAYFLWNKGIELVDASTGSLFLFFQPITGSILGWLCLNEQLAINFFVGGILIILGLVIASRD